MKLLSNIKIILLLMLKFDKEDFFKTKKFWILYAVILVVGALSLTTVNNIHAPLKECIIFLFLLIVGIFFLVNTINKNIELYKSVFCILLIIGIVISVMTPIYDTADEKEHFARSEFISRGVLVPEFNNGSYMSIASVQELYDNNSFKTIESNTAGPINYTPYQQNGVALQNPFYGYLPQGIGIFIAKLLSLDSIYMLILGKIFNSILYAGLVSLAIKKTPILKVPLLAMACIPLALYQSFSISIDSMINGLAIFAISYFLFMFKSKTLDKKEIIIYSVICLLLGLCKLPYLAFIMLLFFIPKNNFNNEKYYYFGFLAFVILGIIGFLWYDLYASTSYISSWRMDYMLNYGINSTLQINFISSHLSMFLALLCSLPNCLYDALMGLFQFSYNEHIYTGNLISMLLIMFIGATTLFYPLDEKFDLKTRIGALAVSVIIFVATYLIQFFTWTPVGQMAIVGTQSRYFLPLFALAPIIFNLSNHDTDLDLENYLLTFIMCFISFSVLLITFHYY